jgi:CubicO group peptidase (beta-lactamase class C family)
MPLAFEPGSGYSYGLSYDVLGFLIERVVEAPILDHLRERVLEPLGMRDTMLVVGERDLGRLATSYYRFDPAVPGETPVFRRSEAPGRTAYAEPPAYVDAGNGLVSSVRDYARFLDAVLSPARHEGSLGRALAALPRDLLAPSMDGGAICEGGGYAAGGYVVRERQQGRPAPGTYGWSGFGGTYFWVDFEAGYWMLLMMQYGPASALAIKPRVMTTQYR